MHCFRASAAP